MALGGGTYTTQNKTLPGTYINFVSAASVSSAASERGVCAAAVELDWGEEGKIIRLTGDEFLKNSLSIFGREYTDEALWPLREMFLGARELLIFRLGGGKKASCGYATARCGGARGNDLTIAVKKNASVYTVTTYLLSKQVDSQNVSSMEELCDNDFVVWDKTATLAATAGAPLEGGENAEVSSEQYAQFLAQCESETFNTLALSCTESEINSMCALFTKRMRNEHGVKFQSVLFQTAADFEGVVNVKNSPELVYWAAGALSGCPLNRSCMNKVYDGEREIECSLTQSELAQCIANGEWTLHRVGSELRVLADINSLTSGEEVFRDNQTMRIIDQIATDDALLFTTKYLGRVPNDESGRASLWADICAHREQMAALRAIEGFEDSHVSVEMGENKKSVVIKSKIFVTNSMITLYICTIVV